MPVDARDARGRSLAELAREALLRAIHDGAFPDDRLPPEEPLALALGVSRPTVRAALGGLEDDGILTRRRRAGTTVNRHVLHSAMRLNRLVSFVSLIAQQGHEPRAEHRVSTAPAGDWASVLGVEHDALCIVVDRLLHADEAPVIAIRDVLSASRVRVPIADLEAGDSTFELIAGACGSAVDYATTDLQPRIADEDRPSRLLLGVGDPFVELLETHYGADHEVLGLSRVRVDSSRVRLSFVRRHP